MQDKSDKYHGSKATNYDRKRDGKPQRVAELAAIASMVKDGPVLDVPCGTGVFFPIYRSKGLTFSGVDISPDMLEQARQKFPDADVHVGSAFALSFPDGWFKTLVSIRFLEWMPIETAAMALKEFRRVAHTLIVSTRHGVEGCGDTYTHDLGKFYQAIDGYMTEERAIVAPPVGEIFKLRPARWSDATDLLLPDYDAPDLKMQLRADKFGAAFGLPSIEVTEASTTVRAEYWTGEEVGAALKTMAERWDHNRIEKHRFIHDKAPRRDDLPMTVLERDGVRLIIDGRHRANHWMKRPSERFQVLVLRPR